MTPVRLQEDATQAVITNMNDVYTGFYLIIEDELEIVVINHLEGVRNGIRVEAPKDGIS